MSETFRSYVWYRIDSSYPGENDWYVFDNHTYDTEESARKYLEELVAMKFDCDFCVVRVTTTEDACCYHSSLAPVPATQSVNTK